MVDLRKNRNLVWAIFTVALIGTLSAIVGIFPRANMTLASTENELISQELDLEPMFTPEEPVIVEPSIIVHVVGAVENPGVYELNEGARVKDACEAAGGLAPKAAQKEVNMALPLSDGQQVLIPESSELVSKPAPQVEKRLDVTQSVPEKIDSPKDTSILCVNVNTAGLSELTQLPGVGEVIGGRIIEYRQKNGPFSIPEDLINVSGIGETKLSKILPYVRVN